MERAMTTLPLADNIKEALLKHAGTMGQILESVLAYEKGDWDDIDLPNVTPDSLTEAYFNAVTDADQITNTL